MKRNINVAGNTMALAHTLQGRYRKMKCSHTQNVRNPFPMHLLITCVLPKHSPTKEKALRAILVGNKSALNLTGLSKSVARMFNKAINEARHGAGLTVTEICEVLTAKNFLVNPHTVKATLQTLVGNVVGSFPQPAQPGKRGRGESLYFLRS